MALKLDVVELDDLRAVVPQDGPSFQGTTLPARGPNFTCARSTPHIL